MAYPLEKIQGAEMMKKEITLGQLLSVAVTLLIAIVTAWVTMNNKVSRLEVRDAEREKQYEKIEAKIDRINDVTTKIYIELQNKQDRSK